MPRLAHLILAATTPFLFAAILFAAAPAGAQTSIPDDCQRWSDGCNTCARGADGTVVCTQKTCAETTPAICLERSRERRAIPENCAVWFDGCNTCRLSGGRTVVCTRRYCGGQRAPARCIRKIGEKP